MKSKKGFTLIELLITVVIMISILAIAIVSVSNLSKKQKENSFERIKEKAITAATDFYYSNEYLFEEMGSNGYSYVTVGYLVENGYLNILTDPTTNETVPYCTKININKVEGIVHLDYDDNPANDDKTACSNDNSFAYTNVDPENATVSLSVNLITKNNDGVPKIYYKNSFNGWYNASVLVDVDVEATVNTNKTYDPSIHKLYYCVVEDGATSCTPDPNNSIVTAANASGINYTDDVFHNNTTDKGKTVCYRSEYKTETNTFEISQHCKTAKVDRELPTVSYEIKDAGISSTISTIPVWKQGKAEFDVSMTDAVSGINTNKYEDIAGNYGFVKIKWNNDNRKTYGTDTYLVKSEVLFTDSIGKIIPIQNGYKRIGGVIEADGARHETYSVCDVAGNCSTKHIYAKIDNTAPTIEYVDTHEDKNEPGYVPIFSVDTGSSVSWRQGKAKFNVKMTDSLSGININKYGNNMFVQIKWNEPGNTSYGSLSNEEYLTTMYEENTNNKVSAITNGFERIGGSLTADGARHETYSVCDNVGNCSTKHIYAKIDNTKPVITNIAKPSRKTNYSICGNKDAIYTEFEVTDNLMVYRIDHFMDDKTTTDSYKYYRYEDIATGKTNITSKSDVESLISVYNGNVTSNKNSIFEYYNFSKNDNSLGTTTISNTNGVGFKIKRAWSDDTVSSAKTNGCGTISSSNKQPGNDVTKYCNYVAAVDAAGNKASAKICNDGTNLRK